MTREDFVAISVNDSSDASHRGVLTVNLIDELYLGDSSGQNNR